MPQILPLPDQAIEIDFTTADEVYIKHVSVERADTVLQEHRHVYGHTTLIAHGSVRLWVDGAHVGDFKAPTPLMMEAEKLHCFQTLEDNTVLCCIHNASHAQVAAVFKGHDL
jgi:hypothetical protein